MGFTHDLVLTLHFLGLFMGGASAFGLPVIGALAEAADPGERPALGRAVRPLKMIGHAGLGLLLLTGFLLAWSGGYFGSAPFWFWLKLLVVVALVAGIVFAGRTGKKAMAGDAEAAAMMPKLSVLNIGLALLILFFASLAFH